MISAIAPCLDFMHGVQKERGLAALYLCSRGKRGGEELNGQFALNDDYAAKIQEPLRSCGIVCDPLLRSVQALPSLRANIMAQHIWANDVIEQYTQALVMPVIGLINDMIVRDPQHIPGRVSAFLYLLHWMERLAREREMVTQLAGQEWMHDEDFANRLKHIIRERQGYERLFWGVADDKQRQACAALKTALPEGRSPAPSGEMQGLEKFSFFNARIDALFEA
ncbi:MAG: nitrate- and nitrite sensing domain-containing protein, partial [Alphaproteobacteria bacterium]|nr:nitrate- and nitrite sensing domain-containing protein [Alphaproteobacteria bacterium]